MAKTGKNIEDINLKLEIDESIEMQKKGWVVQKIGWILMLVFLILAALGLFGNGVLSKKDIHSGDQVFEYPQYSRFESRMELKFDLTSSTGTNIISLPTHYLEKFRIESILPEPSQNKTQNERVDYFFEGSGPMKIVFYLVPQNIGNLNADVRVNEQQYNFNHFIYP